MIIAHLIDGYVCNLEIKLRWNELLSSREIVNRILKERNVLRRRVAKFCANFSRKRKFRFSLLSDAYIIITSMPMFSTYRVKVERIITEVLTAVLCTFEVRERFPNFLMVSAGSCVTSVQHLVSLLWKHSCSFLSLVFLRSIK